MLNWYSGRHYAAIQRNGLRACAAHIEGRTGDTHLWCVWQLVEHKRLSVKTDDILAMQEPMLYTVTRWLCYSMNTSIDPTSIIVIIGELYGIMTRYHLMRCRCLSLFHIHSTLYCTLVILYLAHLMLDQKGIWLTLIEDSVISINVLLQIDLTGKNTIYPCQIYQLLVLQI